MYRFNRHLYAYSMAILIGFQAIGLIGAQKLEVPSYCFDALYTQAYEQITSVISPDMAELLRKASLRGKVSIIAERIGTTPEIRAEIEPLYREAVAHCAYNLLVSYKQLLANHIHRLEQSSVYWQWCLDNPKKYALVKFPTLWFEGSDQSSHIFQKKAVVDHALHDFMRRFGCVNKQILFFDVDVSSQERMLWAEQAVDLLHTHILHSPYKATSWTEMATIISQLDNALQAYSSIDELANVPLMPGHLKRYWLAYAVGAATCITAAAVYGMYHTNIMTGIDLAQKAATNGIGQVKTNALNLKNEIKDILWPTQASPLDGLDKALNSTLENLKPAHVPPSWIPGTVGATLDNVNTTLDSAKIMVTDMVQIAEKHLVPAIKKYDRLIKGQQLNLAMLGLVPLTGCAYGIYKLGSGIKHWFTKLDRRALCAHMYKAQDIVIQANQSQLSDEEYGTLVYALTKAAQQAEKNVNASERTAFIQDICYVAAPSSTIIQKKEMLAQMKQKYQSLKVLV